MLASHRAYADATRWIRSARRRRIAPDTFARGAFTGSFVFGITLLGAIGAVAPGSFVAPGSRTARSGWPALILLGLVGICLLYLLAKGRFLVWLAARLADPFRRPLAEDPSYEGAVNALSACARPYVTRFALAWVWGPVALAVLGLTFAFSAAYFLVDAVLASFRVAWTQPLYGLAFALLSFAAFRAGAPRLTTWRLAASVHRSVTTGYSR